MTGYRMRRRPVKHWSFPRGLLEIRKPFPNHKFNVCVLHSETSVPEHVITHTVYIRGHWVGFCCKHYQLVQLVARLLSVSLGDSNDQSITSIGLRDGSLDLGLYRDLSHSRMH